MLWRKRKMKIILIGGMVLMFYVFIFTSTVIIENLTSQNRNNVFREYFSPQESKSKHESVVTRLAEDLLDDVRFQGKFKPLNLSLDGNNDQFSDVNKLALNGHTNNQAGQVPIAVDQASLQDKWREPNAHLQKSYQKDHLGKDPGNKGSFNYISDILQQELPNAAIHSFNQLQRDSALLSLQADHFEFPKKSSHEDVEIKSSDAVANDVSPHIPSEKKITNTEEVAEDSDCLEVNKNKTYSMVTFPDFVQNGKPEDPGENGKLFRFGQNELSKMEKERKEKDFETHYFDEWVSKKIAVHRSLPDDRPIPCKEQKYATLPNVSVLIVFYNEAWTVLLRTIHSILDRTPDHLLQEIVLLDDFSDLDYLKEPLEVYLQPLAKVHLLRAKERLGLIRARNMVFEHSSGDVVIFLDSHIECFPGWLEPLLAPISANNKTVTFPTIEFLSPATFALRMNTRSTHVGGLSLNMLSFQWLYSRTTIVNSLDNSPSPTMPGGLYAISRHFFRELGKYDPGMDLWGWENVEISFKIWMCGGSILLATCSHVGHIFRTKNPAVRKGGGLGFKNAVRVAEVWMDQYKHFFYEKLLYQIPEFGDVRSRKELRNSLQCHDFAWYLQHVYPELKAEFEENSNYAGHIKSFMTDMCLDRRIESLLATRPCTQSVYQYWNLATNGIIASLDKVIGLQTYKAAFNVTQQILRILETKLMPKNVDVIWVYDNHQRIVHNTTGLCLQADSFLRQAVLKECSLLPWQRWNITTRKEMQEIYKNQGVAIDWSL